MGTKVADEAFLACVAEIVATEQWGGVHHRDIERRASLMFYGGRPARPGVMAHARGHIVANKAPSAPTGYRMLVETPDGLRRPFFPSDQCDAGRDGKMRPSASDMPRELWSLVEWVDGDYRRFIESGGKGKPRQIPDVGHLHGGKEQGPAGIPVSLCRNLPEEAVLAHNAISHEILVLRAHDRPAVLLVDGDTSHVQTWLGKYRHLLGQVSIQAAGRADSTLIL